MSLKYRIYNGLSVHNKVLPEGLIFCKVNNKWIAVIFKMSCMLRTIITIGLFTLCIAARAQQAATNNGNLTVHNGGYISIFGDFTNAASGALLNNGHFYVKGNLTNDQSSLATGAGTLYLDGSNAQTVNGTAPMNVYNLVTNNSAGITLNNNLSVSGTHTFSRGMITTSVTPNYLVYEAGSSYTGSGDSRHVQGWVKKKGNTDFSFPVGDATYERPVAVLSLSAVSEIDCHYYTGTPNRFNLFSPLVLIRVNEYWQLDKISGGTARVTLNWDHAKVPMENVYLADIHSSRYIAGNWTSTGGTASGNVVTTGSITSNVLGSFGQMTLGYTSYPVPLRLISFDGERRAGVTHLQWITENEYDIDHFEVERSYDAGTFAAIGTVPGRNNNNREYYNFDDRAPLLGIAYYRLHTLDIDGKYSYSRIITVSENNRDHPGFMILNPARNVITLFNKTPYDGPFAYQLLNAGGQLIAKGVMDISLNGNAVIPLPPGIASGLYQLELSNTKTSYRHKVLITQ